MCAVHSQMLIHFITLFEYIPAPNVKLSKNDPIFPNKERRKNWIQTRNQNKIPNPYQYLIATAQLRKS